MATVTLDAWGDSGLEIGPGAVQRFTRGGFIENIDLSSVSGDKSQTLYVAAAAIIAQLGGSTTIVNHTNVILTRIFLFPVSDTAARFRIIYEDGGGGVPSTYLISDGAVESEYETNYLPGTREPIFCSWTPAGSLAGKEQPIVKDHVTFRFTRSLRTIVLTALIYGRPSVGQPYVNTVNNNTWPTSGGIPSLPVGFWKLIAYKTDYARQSGYFTLNAAAMSKNDEDWSEFGTLRSSLTGKYAQVDAADVASAAANPYTYTIGVHNGFVHVGPCALTNFVTIFGF